MEMLKTTPDDSFLTYALALEYLKLAKEKEAQILLERLAESDPGYLGTYYQLGKILEKRGELEEAKNIYLRGMGIARAGGELHTLQELQSAMEELES
ncbi:MAG: hypothetical protein ACYCOO_11675 [Chitinophagaceae bacterium]